MESRSRLEPKCVVQEIVPQLAYVMQNVLKQKVKECRGLFQRALDLASSDKQKAEIHNCIGPPPLPPPPPHLLTCLAGGRPVCNARPGKQHI